jgi:glycosyltransferase involved in cell wall biosynthesis
MSSNQSLAETAAESWYRLAVLVPCYNEEGAIAKVVADFRAAPPQAAVYAYDNNSRDDTAAVAKAAGAHFDRVGSADIYHLLAGGLGAASADCPPVHRFDATRVPFACLRLDS